MSQNQHIIYYVACKDCISISTDPSKFKMSVDEYIGHTETNMFSKETYDKTDTCDHIYNFARNMMVQSGDIKEVFGSLIIS